MDRQAFQDQIGGNHCWGCGPLNERGLGIKSYWSESDDGEATCTWQPQPYHMVAPHFLNGGIIATLIDCHCVCTAFAAAYRADGRAMSTEPALAYVTGSLQVTYLRPTPLDGQVVLRARVKEMGERKMTLTCSLYADGAECVHGEVVAVRVPPAWTAAP